mmetsp:Transcript_22504/g.57374  ORF Transcript_22504/g.57374 Transcript_22504/m.57374 type:complete len:229 (+) Transcript_22504:673-1359(+)
MVLAPVHNVVPEEGRHARVRADVGVAHEDLVVWERPVPLGAACVMVVDESHRILGQPTDQARRLAVGIPQPPVLALAACLLQNAFGGEVERGGQLVRGIDPIHQVLPMFVLVVAQAAVVIRHVAPQLADRPGRGALLAVVPDVLCAVPLDEVEAPCVEAHLELHPSEPDADALLHLFVLVINVRRCVELAVHRVRMVLARAIRELVAQGDGPATPVHHARETGPALDA